MSRPRWYRRICGEQQPQAHQTCLWKCCSEPRHSLQRAASPPYGTAVTGDPKRNIPFSTWQTRPSLVLRHRWHSHNDNRLFTPSNRNLELSQTTSSNRLTQDMGPDFGPAMKDWKKSSKHSLVLYYRISVIAGTSKTLSGTCFFADMLEVRKGEEPWGRGTMGERNHKEEPSMWNSVQNARHVENDFCPLKWECRIRVPNGLFSISGWIYYGV